MKTKRSQKEACPKKEIVSFNCSESLSFYGETHDELNFGFFFQQTKFPSSLSKDIFETNEVLKSAAILTDMLKKDEQTRKAVDNIKKDYERLVHDKKVKDILYSQLGKLIVINTF